jgi:hypothetical protein
MKYVYLALVVALCLISAQVGFAQSLKEDHVEIGVFADYFRLDRTDPSLNYAGVGGRIGFNVHPNIQLEGEMAYDFDRNYTNTFDNGITTELVTSKTHILHGLFGPKFQAGTGAFRAFVTGKVGLIDFTTNNQSTTTGFRSALGAVGNGDAKFAVYPGGGVEGFFGPIGLRLEVGDDIYFDNGARNNLRVTFGPTFRF